MSTDDHDPAPGAPPGAVTDTPDPDSRPEIIKDLLHNAVIVVLAIALFVALAKGWL